MELLCKQCCASHKWCCTLCKSVIYFPQRWFVLWKKINLEIFQWSYQLKFWTWLKNYETKKKISISNQIGRSATSVCANIAESKYGHSRADFIAKLEIALKEASETGKWLEMLYKTNHIDETKYKSINKICSTIRILLIASIKTAKQNSESSK